MTTKEVAMEVIARNRAADPGNVYDDLYAPDAVSVENMQSTPEEYKGLEAIKAKAAKWYEGLEEMHELVVSEPLIADASFAIMFSMDVTLKKYGRMKMNEIGIYTVKDGRIVREEFRS